MGYQENAQYFERMFPYAFRASQGTNLPVSFILAQWGEESGYGTSNFAVNHNNHAGINYSKGNSIAQGSADGRHASYASLDQFVQDYIRVMNLSYYNDVRAAGSPEDTITAIGNSPYAEDPNYAGKVKSVFSTYGLSGYDTWGVPGTSAPQPTLPNLPDADGFKQTVSNFVDGLGEGDLKTYAGIGAAIVLVLAVFKS